MSRRSKSASRQMVECLKDQLVEYFEENLFDDLDYVDLSGSDLLEAFVGAFQEIESEMKKKLNPVQFMLEKLDPEKD